MDPNVIIRSHGPIASDSDGGVGNKACTVLHKVETAHDKERPWLDVFFVQRLSILLNSRFEIWCGTWRLSFGQLVQGFCGQPKLPMSRH